jgi:hypothetical protein
VEVPNHEEVLDNPSKACQILWSLCPQNVLIFNVISVIIFIYEFAYDDTLSIM